MSGTGKDCESNDRPFLSVSERIIARPPHFLGMAEGTGQSHVPAGGPRPSAVLCDFDDTTAVENVAQLLLQHFSPDGTWERLRNQAREKSISLREYQERAFRGTGASREEMKAVVKAKATLRPYFKELWQYCQVRSIPLAVVTVGLDFYVDALLEREGLDDVPRYAVKTAFTPGGITFEYPYAWDGSGGSSEAICRQWGNSKCSILGGYRRSGYAIFYVGDGRSDFCPASIADRVFALGQLAELCREAQVPYSEFRDFRDVINGLERHRAGACGIEDETGSGADQRDQEALG